MNKRFLSELNKFNKDRDWDQFHSPKNLAMALTKEAAEILELFQWTPEKGSYNLSDEKIIRLKNEIGDVFIYLTLIASKFNINPELAAAEKLKINKTKYPAQKVRGSSKKYNEY